MSVRSYAQAALDAVLAPDKVYSHWQRKQSVKGESPDEYVVYTVDSDNPNLRANGGVFAKTAGLAVRYYHSFGLDATSTGRESVDARERQIAKALHDAGFAVTAGPFDLGDIDEVGFNTSGFECDCARLTNGQVEEFYGAEG